MGIEYANLFIAAKNKQALACLLFRQRLLWTSGAEIVKISAFKQFDQQRGLFSAGVLNPSFFMGPQQGTNPTCDPFEDPGAPAVLPGVPLVVMLAIAGAPAVLAPAPLAVMLADAVAPAVLALDPDARGSFVGNRNGHGNGAGQYMWAASVVSGQARIDLAKSKPWTVIR